MSEGMQKTLVRILAVMLIIASVGISESTNSIVHAQSKMPAGIANFSWAIEFPLPEAFTLEVAQQEFAKTIHDSNIQTKLIAENERVKALVQGNMGLEQLKQVLYTDLASQFRMTGGGTLLSVTGKVPQNQEIEIILESNPSTGYSWDIASYDAQILEVVDAAQFIQQSERIGAAEHQVVKLRGLQDSGTTFQLIYRRPFEPEAPITSKVIIQTTEMLTQLDLSNPDIPKEVEPQVAPQQEGDALPSLALSQSSNALPSSFDWQALGKVTPVKDQGSCGTCWSFGVAGVMEAALKIAGSANTILSEQYLVSCNIDGFSSDCDEGGNATAHNYHLNKAGKNSNPAGAVLNSDFPYTSGNGSIPACKYVSDHSNKLASWNYLTTSSDIPSVEAIKQAIYTYGPVYVSICAGDAFQAYDGGVFSTSDTCTYMTNHGVILTGWNDSDQTWILKNSWGTDWWGENGYMRIRWGTSNVGRGANYVTIPKAGRLAAGSRHTCMLTAAGGVKCWGSNSFGQLGNGTTTQSLTPVEVSGLTSGVVTIAAGPGSDHTCALTSGGGVKCWGKGGWGQLGDGAAEMRLTPVDVSGLTSGVVAIAVGENSTCALTSSGGMKCWGANSAGELGDGTTDEQDTPVDVSGLTNGVLAITKGWDHTCAVVTGGALKCWGWNQYGTVGDGSQTHRYLPVDVNGLNSGISKVIAGSEHTCALTDSRGVKCWGRNMYGEVGDTTNVMRILPVDVSGISGEITQITAGDSHTCGLTSGGGVKCWGDNFTGELGDQSNTERHAPVNVYGLASGVVEVAAGSYHTCAMMSGGNVKCWGWNVSGQLGNNSTTDSNVPVDIVTDPVCYTLATTASPDGSGSVNVSPAPNCSGSKYTSGTQVQLTAAPATGYQFSFWSGAASGNANPTTITMDGDKSATANFTLPCYVLTTSISPDGSGSVNVSPAPNCSGSRYTSGTQVQLTAAPATGYQFSSWSGAASGNANPTTITMDGDKSATANFTQLLPGQGVIAFNAKPAGLSIAKIHLMDPDGSNVRLLPQNSAENYSPSIAPDGSQRIAFISGSGSLNRIWILDLKTNISNALISDQYYYSYPRWSPDGSKIVYSKGTQNSQEIYITNSDGSGTPLRLTNDLGGDCSPDVSPDGTTIVWGSNGGNGQYDASQHYLYLINVDGTNRRPVLDPGGQGINGTHVRWSSDGERLLFSRYEVISGNWLWVTYIVNSDGTGLRKLLEGALIGDWSPDDSQVVLTKADGIYVMASAGGSEPVRISNQSSDYANDWRLLAQSGQTRPQAAFVGTPVIGIQPLTVSFTNISTGTFTSSLWDFGDGITSTQASPTHTYTLPGVYTVTLTVVGPGGTDTETQAGYITVTLDTIAPTGSIIINGGASYTASTGVTLTLSATDAGSGVQQMRFSNDGTTWSAWEAFATSKSWTVLAGDGQKTVYGQYKDQAGNISFTYSDTIILDTLPPTGTVTINGGATDSSSTAVTLTVSASDAGAGVWQMRFSNDSSTWSAWETYASSKAWSLTTSDGLKTVYVQYKDKWGRVSISYSDTITLDTLPPTGAVTINGGVSYTASTVVTLTLPASGAVQMRFSNDGSTWSAWEPYAAGKSWAVPAGDGLKTVYVQFKDAAGNVSAAYSDTIILDTLPPSGIIIINGGASYTASTAVTLTLSATDSGAGVLQMRFSNDGATWSAWESYAASKSWTMTVGDGLKTVYVQYKDRVGRVSIPFSDTITLDTLPPSGTISINSGASYTLSPTVTLTLSATDSGAGVLQMRFSNDGTAWSAWEAFATSKTWVLTTGDGVKTVYVQYKDKVGRISAIFNDTIILDTIPPTGTISINNGSSYTAGTAVTLTLSAADVGAGVQQMRFSNNGSTWSTWEPYAAGKSWTLTAGDGLKTVYVQYKDLVGNVSVTFIDSITLDTLPPSGTISINGGASYTGSTAVTLTLSATDAGAGVGQMRFSDNGISWGAWESYATSKNWTLIAGDGIKTVYVQYKDKWGRASSAYSDTITLDTLPPSGTISINGGAAYTSSTAVTLALSASDTGAGVWQVRFSNNGTTWSVWETYATSKSWSLTAGDGLKTVYVQYKDKWGRVSTSYSDTIMYSAAL